MDLHQLGHSWVYCFDFSLFISWDGSIMIFRDVCLFFGLLKLDSFSAFVAAGAGLPVFKRSLRDVLFRVFL